MQNDNNRSLFNTIFAISVILAVILTFAVFINGNNKRATEISVKSLKDASLQSAQRIDEVMERAKREIILTSDLYEEMLEQPVVTADDLNILTEESPFDYIEFVDVNGIDINSSGETVDVSNLAYFNDGMQGNSGIDVVFKSQTDNETENVVVFYTPLNYEGDIIGVLVGLYKEPQVEDIIYSTFFDEDSRTFICDADGEIIAGCNYEIDENLSSVFDSKVFNDGLSSEAMLGLKDALSKGIDYEFQYDGTAGVGNAYATPLSSNDWFFIQTYPSQVTSQFIKSANKAGTILLVELIGIFLVCLIVLYVTSSIQKKKLVFENVEKSYVINGITNLFGSFVLVNFNDNTYRYLADTKPRKESFSKTGGYESLRELIVDMVKDTEEKEHIKGVLAKDQLLESLSDGTKCLRYEFAVDGEEEKWDSLNIICVKRVDGIPRELIFTYQDVTMVKSKEQKSYLALKDAYQAVESANQAKTSFLSNMSHDIRTPMNGIIGMTAIAGAHIHDADRVADCLQKITVSSKHLLGLINEVLDMSKIESGKVDLNEEEFRLSDLIDNLLTMVKPQVEAHHHALDITIDNVTHEKVIGDSLRIQQVFMNLMSNAIKYTPDGGNINLTISEKPTNQTKSGFYEITIKDNGIGMSEEFVQRVFEPFLRADDERVTKMQGTGLGMPIARNIVRMMGGDIQVDSRLNEGTKFTVTFFLKLQDEYEVNYAEFINLPVLVADDDQISCESACNILNELGMNSQWVLSGEEALERVLENHRLGEDFFAVILDWKMDGMDGVATTKAIRKELGNDIPIIIISAYDWSDIEQEARKAGVNAFISKPLFKSRMVSLFSELMGINKEKSTEEAVPLANLGKMNLSGKRVLLVEDNELNVEIAKEILETTGINVDCVTNGADAVDKVATIPDGYYDLVLMDIQMPVMNGYEATRAIRSFDRDYTRGLPIIAMTANAFAEDVHMAKGAGMNAHIAKPLDLDVLAGVLQKWVL